MKKIKALFTAFVLAAACLVLLTGCGVSPTSGELPSQSNDVGARVSYIPEGTPPAPDSTPGGGAAKGADVPASGAATKVDIEIGEKMFISQTNDIYLNVDDYLGKTVKYEGIFDVYAFPEEDFEYYSVIRYGPGCCGYDGNAGFEVVWDGDYPKQDDWVEAVGVLEIYEEEGYEYLRVRLSSLTVLDTRGAEYVVQ
jgi:hypothetical protein